MTLLAAAAIIPASIELDLSALFRHYAPKSVGGVTCGIKVVGYHITGRPGQQFGYGREAGEKE